MNTLVIDQVLEQLRALPQDMQWRVLEFARALVISSPHGMPGQQLLRFAGGIAADDVRIMNEAIEQGCEQIDAHGW